MDFSRKTQFYTGDFRRNCEGLRGLLLKSNLCGSKLQAAAASRPLAVSTGHGGFDLAPFLWSRYKNFKYWHPFGNALTNDKELL
jgi:hypothetical protein